MITADRFLASKHIDETAWRVARASGVTATAVAEVAAKKDRAAAIDAWLNPEPFDGNAYTEFGVEQEPHIMRHAHTEHGILPIDWVIGARGGFMASPDGLSVDHTRIAECKTTGDPWDRAAAGDPLGVPIKYRRQVQWQLFVTGAESCLFLWQQRVEDGAWFRPAWFQPRTLLIPRDEVMITALTEVGNDMLAALTTGRRAA